jgi:ELWxxDGT repeat protein
MRVQRRGLGSNPLIAGAVIASLALALSMPSPAISAPLKVESSPVAMPRLEPAAYLVKDIADRGGSTPNQFTKVGDWVFFVAGDNLHGPELWRTNGTPAGTVLVKDIRKGPRGSYPGRLVAVGDLLFFRAETKRHGYELWKSDGTKGGTVLVKDINPGPRSSLGFLGVFGQMEALENTLFFRASDGVTGYEVWRSDGTAEGTSLVRDIWPGRHESLPMMLTAFGDEVFFNAEDPEHGQELWKTDGSTEGTILVKDINPGLERSTPLQLTPVGNTLYFMANDGVHGFELWRTDGSDPGTQLVLDIYPGEEWSIGESAPWAVLGQRLLFPANDGSRGEELWTSDGTSGGTKIVADLVPGSGSLYPDELIVTQDSSAYFFGWADKQIWKTDGTAQGTTPLIRLRTGVFVGSRWRQLLGVGPSVFFQNIDRDHGYELWMTDGSADGTGLAADINPGPGYSTPLPMSVLGTTLLFAAQDGVHGRELWALPTE